MLVGAALLLLGALVNAVGIRNDAARKQREAQPEGARPQVEAAAATRAPE